MIRMIGKYPSKCPECGNVDNLTEREIIKVVHCQRCYLHYEYKGDNEQEVDE